MPVQLSSYLSGITKNVADLNPQGAVTKSTVSAKPTGFLSNLGHSLASIPMAAAKWAVNDTAKTVNTVGHAIAQSLPGIGTAAQFNKSQEYGRNQLMQRLKDTHHAYVSNDPKHKISKDEYLKRVAQINKELTAMSEEGKKFDKTMVTPKDAVKAGAELATLPFAASKLVKGAGVGLKVAEGAEKAVQGGKLIKTVEAASTAAPQVAQVAAPRLGLNGTLEKMAGKIPSIGQALDKSAANQAAGIAERSSLLKTAAGTAVKFPLIAKPTVDTAFQTGEDLKKGKYMEAAGNAALLASGALKDGPIGAAKTLLGKGGKLADKAVYGKDSLFASIKSSDGSTLLDHFNGLNKKIESGALRGKALQNAKQEVEDLKIWHQYKMDENQGNVAGAMSDLNRHVKDRAYDTLTTKEISKDVRRFKKGQTLLDADVAAGNVQVPEGKIARVGRFSADSKNALFKALDGVTDPGERYKKAVQLSEQHQWGDNPNLKERILNAVTDTTVNKNGKEAWRTELGKLTSTMPEDIKIKGMPSEYFPTFVDKSKIRANFKSIDQVTEQVGPRIGSKIPPLQKLVEKLGVSTRANDQAVYPKIEQTATDLINNLGIKGLASGKDGKMIDAASSGTSMGKEALSRLADVAQEKKGVYDLRQLTVREIADSLGVADNMAKKVRGAIDAAHLKTTLGERGLGSRVQDLNIKFNPLARSYSRLQGKYKYESNPFFRAQENIETFLLSQGLSEGSPKALKVIFGGDFNPQPGIQAMKDAGLLRGASFGSQGAVGAPFVSAKLSSYQERTIAGMLTDMAARDPRAKGNIGVLLEDHAVRDMVRSIVQYPSKGFFGSNAARTLNLVAFPISYNFKVAKLATDILAKQNPITQIATVKGLQQMDSWMKSDEGIKWQAKNSEALGIFKYFTPVNSLQSVANILGANGKPQISDFGQLGGLPFGLITQVLIDNGAMTTDEAYLDPKTGEQVPKNLPQDGHAEAYTVLKDLIGSMFNFPGRTVGINISKTDLIDKIPGMDALKQSGTFEPMDPQALTAAQAHKQAVLGAPEKPKTMNPVTFTATGPSPKEAFSATKHSFNIPPPATKAKKAKKPPAWLNGYKTTTASRMPGK